MIEEDQNQMCSNSSGGDGGSGLIITRSSSKKSKQKRVPQRGLGVAQLEKIRMEEQKNDGNNQNNNVSSTYSSPLLSMNSSSQNTIPFPNYSRTSDQKSLKPCVPYSSPLPPPMPMHLAPQNAIFKTCNALPKIENFHLNSIIPCSGSTNEIDALQENGWPSIPAHGSVSSPKMWHPTSYDISLDHNNIESSVFLPHLSLPYDTCDIAALPPRSSSTPTQPPTLITSMVNASSTNSSSSSSALHFPIEPPSNQRLYCNYSSPLLWPDNEKMIVGMKRTCPFPLDNLPIPTFDNKFNPSFNHPFTNEQTTGENQETTYNNLDDNIPIFRDIPSYSSLTMPELGNLRKINRIDNYNPHTLELLSSPTFNSSLPNVKQFCRLDSLSYQVNIGDTLIDSRQGVATKQQSNMFNFFPITAQQVTSSPSSHNRSNSEIGDNIDLNLKL